MSYVLLVARLFCSTHQIPLPDLLDQSDRGEHSEHASLSPSHTHTAIRPTLATQHMVLHHPQLLFGFVSFLTRYRISRVPTGPICAFAGPRRRRRVP